MLASCRHRHLALTLATALLFLGIGSVTEASETGRPTETSERPNVVLIVADDLGWKDLGCYGSSFYETPHLDSLSSQGLRFTDAYSCGPNCAPTRACLMSGRYTPVHGIYTVGSGARGKSKFRRLTPPENQTVLHRDFVTLGELFRDAGYATAHFGKWHLGEPGSGGPTEQGFEKNVGGNKAGHPKSYFSPYRNPNLADGPKGENLTDRLSMEVVQFIRDHQDEAFFAYVPYYAVHTPIQAKASLTEKYRDKEATEGQSNPKYAAMVETMDTGIGTILSTLDELEIADNTLVIFTSDNGGLGGYHAAGIDGGQEITSQAPLRGGKGMLYEGGIRVPLIMRWPGKIEADATRSTIVNSVDFLPTLCAAAGITDLPPHDGRDISACFSEEGESVQRSIFWHFPGYLEAGGGRGTWRTTPGGAIREGQWKLIQFFEDDRVELYDLAQDIGEQNNLAEQHPDIRDRMLKSLQQWRQDLKAPMPTPNDGYQGR